MARVRREKWDQAKDRRTATFRDQHGREWYAVKDIHTDAPIGPLAPAGWIPVQYQGRDLVPDTAHLSFDENRPGVFTIDYDRWKRDIQQALTNWTFTAGSYAASMYGDKAFDALQSPPPALLNQIGPKPMPIELVEAQEEGNRWILGLDPKKPKWADEFFKEVEVVPGTRRFADADDEKAPKTPRAATGRFKSAEEE